MRQIHVILYDKDNKAHKNASSNIYTYKLYHHAVVTAEMRVADCKHITGLMWQYIIYYQNDCVIYPLHSLKIQTQ